MTELALLSDEQATAPQRPELAIVLVGPQLGQNIGFVARAMLNFGLTDLRLVAPRDGWPNPQAVAPASGAVQVIENAKVFENLEAAISDCQWVGATTARPRDLSLPVISPVAVPAQVQSLTVEQAALIFGRESSGLTTPEVALCNSVVQVPLNPEFSSLNLAQAVLLTAYEWFQYFSANELAAPKAEPLATNENFDNLMNRLEARLDQTRFLDLEARRPVVLRNVRSLFAKANLTNQEIQTLHGIFKALQQDR